LRVQVTSAPLTEEELAAWRGFMRAHAAVVKELDAELEARYGLPLSSYDVLATLAERPEGRMRMCDLAEAVALSRSGLTRLVDRLQREGLMARAQCAHDARGSFAVLTDAGRERLREAAARHHEAVRRRFLSHFSDAELRQMTQCFRRIDLTRSD
jgi:DNA-binding MarR family transcriptional regulator